MWKQQHVTIQTSYPACEYSVLFDVVLMSVLSVADADTVCPFPSVPKTNSSDLGGVLIRVIDWLTNLSGCSLLMVLHLLSHWSANLVFQHCLNYSIVREQLAAAFNQIHNQHVLSQRQLLKASKLPPTHPPAHTYTHSLTHTHTSASYYTFTAFWALVM